MEGELDLKGVKCCRCGLPAELSPTIAPDGSNRTRQHARSHTDAACLDAVIEEVKQLRAQVDYLTDLVEDPKPEAKTGLLLDCSHCGRESAIRVSVQGSTVWLCPVCNWSNAYTGS